MPPKASKAKEPAPERPILGRFSSHLKIGIVRMNFCLFVYFLFCGWSLFYCREWFVISFVFIWKRNESWISFCFPCISIRSCFCIYGLIEVLGDHQFFFFFVKFYELYLLSVFTTGNLGAFQDLSLDYWITLWLICVNLEYAITDVLQIWFIYFFPFLVLIFEVHGPAGWVA